MQNLFFPCHGYLRADIIHESQSNDQNLFEQKHLLHLVLPQKFCVFI